MYQITVAPSQDPFTMKFLWGQSDSNIPSFLFACNSWSLNKFSDVSYCDGPCPQGSSLAACTEAHWSQSTFTCMDDTLCLSISRNLHLGMSLLVVSAPPLGRYCECRAWRDTRRGVSDPGLLSVLSLSRGTVCRSPVPKNRSRDSLRLTYLTTDCNGVFSSLSVRIFIARNRLKQMRFGIRQVIGLRWKKMFSGLNEFRGLDCITYHIRFYVHFCCCHMSAWKQYDIF